MIAKCPFENEPRKMRKTRKEKEKEKKKEMGGINSG
jgi:hypothetical protein